MNYLAEVFPEKALTLLHGQQGSGKSFSCIKALNEDGIKPVYIAVEDTAGLIDLDKFYTSEELLIKMINREHINDLKNKVVIIDTYTRTQHLLESDYSKQGIVDLFEALIKFYDITLIVIGHTRAFVGKDGIFDDNIYLARNSTEELFLEKTSYKKTKTEPARIEYNLHIVKGRGNGGAKVVPNWMREKAASQQIKEL